MGPFVQEIEVKYPTLPTERIGKFGVYFGIIDLEDPQIAMQYCEYPCLGVAAETLYNAVVRANTAGRYQSVLDLDGYSVNENLLGYFDLSQRTSEARSRLQELEILNEEPFPEDVENTAFNVDLLLYTSQTLRVYFHLKLFILTHFAKDCVI